MTHIVLDSSPLGLLCNASASPVVLAISQWSRDCIAAGHQIYIPEIIDYELRRELIRAGKTNALAKLDSLKHIFNFIPISTDAMLLAANLWASSRQQGISTADPRHLDIDVLLCAQTLTMALPVGEIIVATSNISQISRFVIAKLWTNIVPGA